MERNSSRPSDVFRWLHEVYVHLTSNPFPFDHRSFVRDKTESSRTFDIYLLVPGFARFKAEEADFKSKATRLPGYQATILWEFLSACCEKTLMNG
jgi:hypothetical protein